MLWVHLAEKSDSFLGKSVAQVLAFRGEPEAVERQHREPNSRTGSGDNLDGGNEAVAFACNRLDEFRRFGRVAQKLSDFANRTVNASFHVDKNVLAPKPVGDVCAGDELPVTLYQEDQELHEPALQLHRAALASQLVSRYVEFEVAKAEQSM